MIYGKCSAGLSRLMCIMKSSLSIHMDKRGTGHINRVYRGGAGMARAYFGLARWGITLILPESLPAFQEIVIADRRMNRDGQLAALADKISEAIRREKYMIHFGV